MLWYLYPQYEGLPAVQGFQKSNIAALQLSKIVHRSFPLVPLPFWHIVFLVTVWGAVGYMTDYSTPARLSKNMRFSRRLLILLGLAIVCVFYNFGFIALSDSVAHSKFSLLVASLAKLMAVAWYSLMAKFGQVLHAKYKMSKADELVVDLRPQIRPYILQDAKAWVRSLQKWHMSTAHQLGQKVGRAAACRALDAAGFAVPSGILLIPGNLQCVRPTAVSFLLTCTSDSRTPSA